MEIRLYKPQTGFLSSPPPPEEDNNDTGKKSEWDNLVNKTVFRDNSSERKSGEEWKKKCAIFTKRFIYKQLFVIDSKKGSKYTGDTVQFSEWPFSLITIGAPVTQYELRMEGTNNNTH